MRAGWPLAIVAALAGACEAVVGADFDDKQLVPPSGPGGSGSGGSGGAGGSKLALGEPCDDPLACESGYCADGVCCNSACESECTSCAIAAGNCQPLAAGTDCTSPAPGRCDGAGTCATGIVRWAARFGDTDLEEATACAFEPNGALWVAGRFEGTVSLGGNVLSQTALADGPWIFVAKFSASGQHMYSAAFGTQGNVDVTGLDVDAAGGPAITGTYQGVIDVGGSQLSSPSARAGYLIKMDATGSHEWHAGFDGTQLFARNGSVPDVLLQHVALGANGEAYVAGAYSGTANIGSDMLTPGGNAGTYLARIDAGGSIAWAVTSSSDPPGIVAPSAVVARPGGGAIVGGQFDDADAWFGSQPKLTFDTIMGNGGHEVFLAAYGDDGTDLWARDYGDPASQLLEDLAITPGGELLLTGSFLGQLNFGGGNVFHPSGDPTQSLEVDLFAARLDVDAAHTWSAGFGPFHSNSPLFARAASDDAGNAVLSALQLGATVDFGIGPLAPEPYGWFLTKLAADATPLWSQAFGTEPPQSGAAVRHWVWDVEAASGGIALCGFAVDSIEFGTGVLPQTSDAPDAIIAVFEP